MTAISFSETQNRKGERGEDMISQFEHKVSDTVSFHFHYFQIPIKLKRAQGFITIHSHHQSWLGQKFDNNSGIAYETIVHAEISPKGKGFFSFSELFGTEFPF